MIQRLYIVSKSTVKLLSRKNVRNVGERLYNSFGNIRNTLAGWLYRLGHKVNSTRGPLDEDFLLQAHKVVKRTAQSSISTLKDEMARLKVDEDKNTSSSYQA